MGEGWENARRRGPGNDWAVFELAARGRADDVEVDTSYFIGNAPGWVRLQRGRRVGGGSTRRRERWWDVVPRTPVLADTRHRFLVPSAGRPPTCGSTSIPTAG